MADEQAKPIADTFIPFQPTPEEEQAKKLQQSMAYGAGQNPDAYAKLITLHKQTGVPPQVAQGNEAEVEHAAKVNSIDYPAMAVSHPRTSSWVSNPDNAAVSHDDIGTLTNIESFGDRLKRNYKNEPFSFIPGAPTVKALVKTVTETPAVRDLNVNNGKTLGQVFDDAKFLFEGVNKPLDTPILQPLSTGIDYLANNRPEVTKGVIPDAVWNIIAGVSKGLGRTAAGLSTPKNLAILGGTGGLSLGQKALLDTYFASEMIPGLLETPKRIMDAPNASEGIAAGVEGLINAYFTKGVVSGIGGHTPFVEDLAQIITSGELSKLKQRSPEKFHEALTEIFDGHDSLQIPVEQFDTYFQSKNINPVEVAQQMGAKNYLEAKATGGHVEVAPQDFIGKLDSEHQKGLLGDVRNPSDGMTFNERTQGEEELQKFISEGGIEKLTEETAKADAETEASPEYQALKEQLRQQYVDAGETPEVADSYATLQANVYANLARETGMKPTELMGLYRPVMKVGEAPGEGLNQAAYHGSPFKFDKFTLEHIGKGEGAQAYGWGLYFAGNKAIADYYRKTLASDGFVTKSGDVFDPSKELSHLNVRTTLRNRGLDAAIEKARQIVKDNSPVSELAQHDLTLLEKIKNEGGLQVHKGQLYEADIPSDDTMLHWDKPLSEQPEAVKKAVEQLIPNIKKSYPNFNFDNATGQGFYNALTGHRGGHAEFASKALHEAGVSGIKYLDGSSRSKGEGNHNYVVFDGSAIKILKTYYQGENTQPRGWFRVLSDGSFEIGKTKIGDLSTFVHEPAHSYLFLMNELVKREGASENLKGDYTKILDFLGAKDGEALTTEQHEKWARANEQYLREGKAPSEGLKGVFQRFSVWLSSIYKRASDLGVELSDDIRGVMDRLYASEDGVNRAAKESGDTGEVVDRAKAEILGKLNEAAIREKTDAWREEEQTVKEAVTAEIDQKPEYRALRILSDGKLEDGTPLALNRDELVKQFGEARVKELQLQNKRIYRLKGGVDAETAAEVLGFNSGEEMMKAMETAPKRSAAIEQATRAFMTAKHGDIRYDGTLDDQARIALENDKKASNLHKEAVALQKQVDELKAKASGQKIPPKSIPPIAAIRTAAEVLVAEKPLMDLQPTRYLDASRKASRESLDARDKGDPETAVQAKIKELVNHYLFREAVKLKEEAQSIKTYADSFKKASQREKIAKAGGADGQHVYLDQADNILNLFRFSNETNKSIQQRQQEFAAFAALKQQEAVAKFHTLNPDWAANHPDGELPEITPPIDPSIAANPRNYRELNIVELRAVRDALKNIKTKALNEYSILVNGKRMDLDQAAADAVLRARENLKAKPVPRAGATLTLAERVISPLLTTEANLQKMEWLVNLLDGGDINGPWRKMVKKPIDDANGKDLQLRDEVNKSLMKQPRPQGLDKPTDIFFPYQADRPMSRYQLVSWLFNMGTAENQKVALIGEGLMNPDGSLRPEVGKVLNGTMRKEELLFIQNVWDTLEEKVWPAVRERQLRLDGKELKRKTLTPFDVTTVDGEVVHMRGGYYPLKADFSDKVSVKQDPSFLQTVGMQKPKTSDSARQQVTGATYKLKTDFESVITQHLNDVIKDSTTGEAIDSVYRFITHNDVRTTLRETLGEESAKEFMVWLQDFNGNMRPGVKDNLGIVNFFLRRKTGIVVAQLGGNISSVAVQTGDVFKSLVNPDVKNKYLLKSFIDIRRNPTRMIEEIRQKSPNEMRFREEHFNREFADRLKDQGTFDAKKQHVTDFVFQSFAAMDRLTTFTAWLARYRQGIDTHGNEAQAIAEADRTIAHGYQAGDNRNMSRMMRSGGLVRLLTTFQGDANTWFGIIASSVRQASSGATPEIRAKGLKAASVALMGLVAEQVFAQYIRNRGKKDDESYLGWATEQTLLGISNIFPVFGDFAQYGIKKAEGEYAGSVQNPTYSGIERSLKGATDVFDKKKDWQEKGQGLTEATGIWVGIPGTIPLVRAWRYIHNVQTGKEPAPKGPVEAVRGAAQGSNRKR